MDKRWSPIWLDFPARAGIEERGEIVQRWLQVPAQGPKLPLKTPFGSCHRFAARWLTVPNMLLEIPVSAYWQAIVCQVDACPVSRNFCTWVFEQAIT